jgi:PncC family amidohydrolase
MVDLLSPAMTAMALDLGPRLIDLGATVAAAESLTGGLVSATLTYVPGSSAFFLAGVTAYADSAKEKILSVGRFTLETYGAVSSRTVLAMAKGVKKLTGADIGLATTGLAGPDGASLTKPLGLFYVAAIGLDQELWAERNASGSRHEVVEAAALSVLDLLSRLIAKPIGA